MSFVKRPAPWAITAKPADEQVPGAGLVQRPADADDVFRLRRSCVAIIIRGEAPAEILGNG